MGLFDIFRTPRTYAPPAVRSLHTITRTTAYGPASAGGYTAEARGHHLFPADVVRVAAAGPDWVLVEHLGAWEYDRRETLHLIRLPLDTFARRSSYGEE